jgi:hypothetical protein
MGKVFVGSEALSQGALTEYELRRWYRRIFRDVYVPKQQEVSLRDRIEGAWLRSGRQGVVAGVAASALLGAPWVDDDHRIPVTTRERTAFDLGRHLPRDEAVTRLDALMWNSTFDTEDVLLLWDAWVGM